MTEKETRPFYTMAQKILDAKVPIATMDGGLHRIDLTVEEYRELVEELFGHDGQSEKPEKG